MEDYAATGVDPLLEGSKAAAPTGLPLGFRALPSRWEGPWQGGEVRYDTHSHSPWRDGVGHYRRRMEGEEVVVEGEEGGGEGEVGTQRLQSPRSPPRVSLTGAGKDAHLSFPTPQEQLLAVSGRGGGGGLRKKSFQVLGSLPASLARVAAEGTLAEALHPGKAGFLTRASPRSSSTHSNALGDTGVGWGASPRK